MAVEYLLFLCQKKYRKKLLLVKYFIDICVSLCMSLFRKRKLQEVAKHEKLPKHPNCVSFVKAWEERQHLYIQTELCKTR